MNCLSILEKVVQFKNIRMLEPLLNVYFPVQLHLTEILEASFGNLAQWDNIKKYDFHGIDGFVVNVLNEDHFPVGSWSDLFIKNLKIFQRTILHVDQMVEFSR